MFRRPATVLIVGLAAALVLTGCKAQDSTGRVTVTVSPNEAEHAYMVEVLVPNGRTAAHQKAFPGDRLEFAGIAVGKVRVRADDLCTQTTTVLSGQVTDVTLSSTGC
ncbi:hypothetical protein [Curtobacterium sp. VKM Ac-2922]|uniref:hypothetical protein n=1 Tax=Curtobacterium sp. VKM Ac-2922 TaxID=2929475 RepID=UPI001FB211B6|nr:hypothetical protein [Curtobacterium sp. VKM Ac-2922]MCJ1714794.1 hypothetical protein [Curtobacterium sp. VKM Ac-2922]